jgi:hypothetical protein
MAASRQQKSHHWQGKAPKPTKSPPSATVSGRRRRKKLGVAFNHGLPPMATSSRHLRRENQKTILFQNQITTKFNIRCDSVNSVNSAPISVPTRSQTKYRMNLQISEANCRLLQLPAPNSPPPTMTQFQNKPDIAQWPLNYRLLQLTDPEPEPKTGTPQPEAPASGTRCPQHRRNGETPTPQSAKPPKTNSGNSANSVNSDSENDHRIQHQT